MQSSCYSFYPIIQSQCHHCCHMFTSSTSRNSKVGGPLIILANNKTSSFYGHDLASSPFFIF
jgi:hypothetical protein